MDRLHHLKRLPWLVIVAAAALAAIGYLSIARAEEIAGSDGQFARQQLLWAAIAVVAASATFAVANYRVLMRYSYLLLVVSTICLAAVYLFPPVNGAHRWIRVYGFGFQPSEFAKLAFVLALARYLMYRESYRRIWGLFIPLGLAFIPMVLILREPDLGTALIFLPVLFVMLFAAGARQAHLGLAALTAVALVPALWSQMSAEQRSRITALAEQPLPGQKVSDDAFHLHRAKQVLALGGLLGSAVHGELSEDRTAYYVPEAHTDSVFSIVGERLGVVGLAVVLVLYVLIIARLVALAQTTYEPFGRLVAVGVASMLGVQVIINTGMMVGVLPITGLALPLVSYGGSSFLATAVALGLVLNIAVRQGYEVSREPFQFAD